MLRGARNFNVQDLASLARLELPEAEADVYEAQLARILDYAAQILSVPTDGVPPMTHVLAAESLPAADIPSPSLTCEEALIMGPDTAGGLFRVPGVLESS